jgi:tetratricopeptide (TPR) repeat protein
MQGYARIGVSYLALQKGLAAESVRGYRTAIRQLAGAHDPRALRTARAGLGHALLELGKVDEARLEYERVLAESRSAGDRFNQADAVNDLGSIEFLYGDPARAVPLYREASALQRTLGRDLLALTSIRNVGLCLSALDRDDEAGALFDSVATEARARGDLDIQARLLCDLSKTRSRQGRLREAEEAALRAHGMRDSIALDAWVYSALMLASAQNARGAFEEARQTILNALDAVAGTSQVQMHHQLMGALGRTILASGDPRGAIAPLREASQKWLGYGGAQKLNRMTLEIDIARAFMAMAARDSALVHFREAADAWQSSRTAPGDEEWRAAFNGVAGRLYGLYAAALLDGGRDEGRAREAFAILQAFRSRSLEEAIRGTGSRESPPRVSLATFQRSVLRPGEVFVDIYAGRDTTIVLAVTRETVRGAGAPAAESLVPRLRRWRDLMASGAVEGPLADEIAAALARDLLGPLAGSIASAHTVLLSAGGLGEFPLGMLQLPGEHEPLAARRVFAIVPSATLLAEGRVPAGERTGDAGIIALCRATDARGERLEGIARESRWLSHRFGEARVRENDGTRSLEQMLNGLGSHAVLHVASHTRWNRAAPWRAGFLLGQGQGEEAYLTADRIAQLRSPARVCVLAGCASAGGSTNAEGLPSLAAAWLTSGASAVVATLWQIDDRATTDLVMSFYDGLAHGRSTGEALAGAQRATRATHGREDPRFWAGFVLLGDPDTRVTLDVAAGARAPKISALARVSGAPPALPRK